jgi:hypothetical protein
MAKEVNADITGSKIVIDPKDMHRAKAQRLGIELTVQQDLSRIKFHRMGRSVQWRDLTECEQFEVIDALELAITQAKVNAKIDRELTDWAEKNRFIK